MRRKKKKGETAVEPQIHPRVIIPKLKRFASPNFRLILCGLGYVAWATEHESRGVLPRPLAGPKLNL
jgi:hypothetical protein